MQTIAGDIADPHHRQAVIEIVRRHGRLDVLVNNAGTCDDGPLGQQSLDDLRRVIEVNLISVMDLCRLAADLLRAAPAASVINVASMYGIVASSSPMAAYNATKATLINLARHLAAVWGQDGVRVNALAPGYFPTELTGVSGRPRLRAVHPRPHAARPHSGARRTRRPAALPRHRRLQLHDRASPCHRRRMDRGMTRQPQRKAAMMRRAPHPADQSFLSDLRKARSPQRRSVTGRPTNWERPNDPPGPMPADRGCRRWRLRRPR